ncbi:MAG: OmpA family protein [Bacteroidota bacterium]
MKPYFVITLSVIILLFSVNIPGSFAQTKAIKLIGEGKYDEANELLKKKYDKSPDDITVNFAFAKLYIEEEFEDYDIEYAYKYIKKTEKLFLGSAETERKKLEKIPINKQIITNEIDKINGKAFKKALWGNTVDSYEEFIKTHPDTDELIKKAKQSRNKLAFDEAKKINTWKSYYSFIQKYPNADQYGRAKTKYQLIMKKYKLLYEEKVWDGELVTLQKFIQENPGFPQNEPYYVKDLELANQAWELGLTERIPMSPFDLSDTKGTNIKTISKNDELNRRLKREGAKAGVIQLTLMWNNYNDLDLRCITPNGEKIWYKNRTGDSGSDLDVDMNNTYGGRIDENIDGTVPVEKETSVQRVKSIHKKKVSIKPIEHIYWPAGKIPSGKYKVYVVHYMNYQEQLKGNKVEFCEDPTEYTLRVEINGKYHDFSGKLTYSKDKPEHLVYEFDYKAPGLMKVELNAETRQQFDKYIKEAAPREMAYIAVQKLIEQDIKEKKWESAIATLKKYQSSFSASQIMFNRIGELILLVEKKEPQISVENLGPGVNTTRGEYSPVISANDKILYFCGRDRTDNIGKEDIFYSEIMYSDTYRDGVIERPRESVSDYVSGTFNEFIGDTIRSVTINTTEDKVIYTIRDTIKDRVGKWEKSKLFGYINTSSESEAPLSVSVDGNTMVLFKAGDLHYSKKTISGWSKLEKFPYPVNTQFWEGDAMLSSDGKAIIFASNRPGGYNINVDQDFYHGDVTYASDIYVCTKTNNGWSNPINLGKNINTAFCERSPFLHPDMKTLYFSSDGHYGLGKLDVFKVTRLSETDWTKWTKPVNLGKSINTTGSDWGYNINTSGLYAYFAADNEANKYQEDIYRVELPPYLRPNVVVTVSGKVSDKNGKHLDADIYWEDLTENKPIGNLKSNPGDGTYFIILPAGKLYGYYAEKDGYYPVSKNLDLRKTNTFQEIRENITMVSIEDMKKLGTIVKINNIFFDTDKTILRPESYPELNRLTKILKENPYSKIEIMGHTDNVGTDEYNQELSDGRAKAVFDYLLNPQGFENPEGFKERLTYKGFGETKPVSTNETEKGRQNNRRVEFKFVN